jgi:hypothetical protein
MEAKELRIDNYVNIGLKSSDLRTDYDAITASGLMDLQVNKESSSFTYEPIPLTEEWLVKFGFTKDKKHTKCCDLKLENDFYLQGIGYGKSNFKYEVILTDSNDNELTLVKHVHQLQNLYFALTNKELKLK